MGRDEAHNLAVKEMLADHDRVHGRGVVKSEECEAARASVGVAHDRARLDLAKLCKVLSQRLCSNHRLALLRAEEQTIVTYVPSVVSQLRPPMNILLQTGAWCSSEGLRVQRTYDNDVGVRGVVYRGGKWLH